MAYLNERPVAQGELEFWAVTPDHFDGVDTTDMTPEHGAYILAHSESGHHHTITMERATVAEVKQDSPGLAILRLIVTDPDGADVVNLNPSGHKNLYLVPRVYEVRKAREMGMDDVIRQSRD